MPGGNFLRGLKEEDALAIDLRLYAGVPGNSCLATERDDLVVHVSHGSKNVQHRG